MLRAMSRLLIPILLAVLFAGVSSGASAQASSFKHCGGAGAVYAGQVKLANVRAKSISCREARRFARRFTLKSGPETSFACAESLHCTWRGWSCLNDARSGDLKHRCRKANPSGQRVMVVKWNFRSVSLRGCGSVKDPKGPRSEINASEISCLRARRLVRRYVQDDKLARTWIAVNPAGCEYLMYRRKDRDVYDDQYSPHAGAPLIAFTKYRGCNS